MHSTPDRNNKNDKRSRAEQYGAGHPYTCLPKVGEHGYMTQLFIDAGMVSQGGMGVSAITWAELEAFDRCNKLHLKAWEFSVLMDMSREYCKWNGKGSKQKDIADEIPYVEETEETRTNMRSAVIRQRDSAAERTRDIIGD